LPEIFALRQRALVSSFKKASQPRQMQSAASQMLRRRQRALAGARDAARYLAAAFVAS
jgi:hypothetical protein